MTGISGLIDTALAAVMDLVGGVPPGPPAAGAH
jgi:hypothetical protein